ncbi:MAG: ABC transporter substrate-binding protein [Actinomycetes bacterium]
MKTRLTVISSLVVISCLSAGLTACGGSSDSSGVKVGAILDLSSGWTSLGKESQAALQQAAADYKAKTGKTVEVKVIDSAGDKDKAAAAVSTLAGEGFTVIIGPGGSSQAGAAAPIAKQKGVVLISPGSTSSALAKTNDGLLRFVPDDRVESKATVALMDKNGVQQLVPVGRTDLGNQGLYDSVTAAWTKLKGAGSVSKGVTYPDTQTKDFGKVADQVSASVTQAQAKGKTAVYLAGFGEAAGIVSAAKAPATSVTWYGGDGVVGDPAFTKDATVAKATQAVCLPSPQTGLSKETKATWQPVLDSLSKAAGGQADAFGVNAFDASNAAIAVLAGTGKGKTGAELETALIAYANQTTGASGSLKLNQFGDREVSAYDFWQVTGAPAAAKWTVSGGWSPAGGTLGTVVKAPNCG